MSQISSLTTVGTRPWRSRLWKLINLWW